MLKIGVGYARTSGEVNPKTSIPNQINSIKEYCEKQEIILRKIYIDECKTGTMVEGRDQYIEMKQVLEKEEINIVIVSNFDRLGRQSLEFTHTVTTLKKQNIGVISVAQNQNSMDMSSIQIAMAGMQAEMENNFRIERLATGRRQVRKQGKFNRITIPFGYELNSERFLIINERNAKIVRNIFEIFLKEKNYSKTVKLIKEKFPTFTYNRQVIRKILSNAIYTGKDCILKKDLEGNIYFERISSHQHEPIITEEIYLKSIEYVDDLDAKYTKKTYKQRGNYLLTKIIKCKDCNTFINGSNGNYICECKEPILLEMLHKEWLNCMNTLQQKQPLSENDKKKDILLKKMEKINLRFATCKINQTTYEKAIKEIQTQIYLLAQQEGDNSEKYGIEIVVQLFNKSNKKEFRKKIQSLKLQFEFDPKTSKVYIR